MNPDPRADRTPRVVPPPADPYPTRAERWANVIDVDPAFTRRWVDVLDYPRARLTEVTSSGPPAELMGL